MDITPQLINNPVGLDLVIQDLQIYLQSNLPEIEFVYGKAFKNEGRNGKFIPEVYIGNKEYKEIFPNDNLRSLIFFDVEQVRNSDYKGNTKLYELKAIVRLICFANLQRIYTSLNHRANENLLIDIQTAVNPYKQKYATWIFQSIKEGVNNVFENYNYELSDKLNNLHPYYLVALEYEVTYSNEILC